MTDQEIAHLISCEKVFCVKPRDASRVNKNMQQRFSVVSSSDQKSFEVFIAHSLIKPLDFSLGLMHDGFLLFRVNGFHGVTRSGFFTAKHHAYPHTHTLTQTDVDRGNPKSPSRIDDVSGEYIDLFTATLYFFRRCGIIGFEKYFETSSQVSLFDPQIER